MELACQNCGHKATVQGFLAAAQQACVKCGQLLMGELGKGTRTVRPDAPAAIDVPADPCSRAASNAAGLWLGVVVGLVGGIGLVVLLSQLGGSVLPRSQQGAALGALAGVLLCPVLAV